MIITRENYKKDINRHVERGEILQAEYVIFKLRTAQYAEYFAAKANNNELLDIGLTAQEIEAAKKSRNPEADLTDLVYAKILSGADAYGTVTARVSSWASREKFLAYQEKELPFAARIIVQMRGGIDATSNSSAWDLAFLSLKIATQFVAFALSGGTYLGWLTLSTTVIVRSAQVMTWAFFIATTVRTGTYIGGQFYKYSQTGKFSFDFEKLAAFSVATGVNVGFLALCVYAAWQYTAPALAGFKSFFSLQGLGAGMKAITQSWKAFGGALLAAGKSLLAVTGRFAWTSAKMGWVSYGIRRALGGEVSWNTIKRSIIDGLRWAVTFSALKGLSLAGEIARGGAYATFLSSTFLFTISEVFQRTLAGEDVLSASVLWNSLTEGTIAGLIYTVSMGLVLGFQQVLPAAEGTVAKGAFSRVSWRLGNLRKLFIPFVKEYINENVGSALVVNAYSMLVYGAIAGSVIDQVRRHTGWLGGHEGGGVTAFQTTITIAGGAAALIGLVSVLLDLIPAAIRAGFNKSTEITKASITGGQAGSLGLLGFGTFFGAIFNPITHKVAVQTLLTHGFSIGAHMITFEAIGKIIIQPHLYEMDPKDKSKNWLITSLRDFGRNKYDESFQNGFIFGMGLAPFGAAMQASGQALGNKLRQVSGWFKQAKFGGWFSSFVKKFRFGNDAKIVIGELSGELREAYIEGAASGWLQAMGVPAHIAESAVEFIPGVGGGRVSGHIINGSLRIDMLSDLSPDGAHEIYGTVLLADFITEDRRAACATALKSMGIDTNADELEDITIQELQEIADKQDVTVSTFELLNELYTVSKGQKMSITELLSSAKLTLNQLIKQLGLEHLEVGISNDNLAAHVADRISDESLSEIGLLDAWNNSEASTTIGELLSGLSLAERGAFAKKNGLKFQFAFELNQALETFAEQNNEKDVDNALMLLGLTKAQIAQYKKEKGKKGDVTKTKIGAVLLFAAQKRGGTATPHTIADELRATKDVDCRIYVDTVKSSDPIKALADAAGLSLNALIAYLRMNGAPIITIEDLAKATDTDVDYFVRTVNEKIKTASKKVKADTEINGIDTKTLDIIVRTRDMRLSSFDSAVDIALIAKELDTMIVCRFTAEVKDKTVRLTGPDRKVRVCDNLRDGLILLQKASDDAPLDVEYVMKIEGLGPVKLRGKQLLYVGVSGGAKAAEGMEGSDARVLIRDKNGDLSSDVYLNPNGKLIDARLIAHKLGMTVEKGNAIIDADGKLSGYEINYFDSESGLNINDKRLDGKKGISDKRALVTTINAALEKAKQDIENLSKKMKKGSIGMRDGIFQDFAIITNAFTPNTFFEMPTGLGKTAVIMHAIAKINKALRTSGLAGWKNRHTVYITHNTEEARVIAKKNFGNLKILVISQNDAQIELYSKENGDVNGDVVVLDKLNRNPSEVAKLAEKADLIITDADSFMFTQLGVRNAETGRMEDANVLKRAILNNAKVLFDECDTSFFKNRAQEGLGNRPLTAEEIRYLRDVNDFMTEYIRKYILRTTGKNVKQLGGKGYALARRGLLVFTFKNGAKLTYKQWNKAGRPRNYIDMSFREDVHDQFTKYVSDKIKKDKEKGKDFKEFATRNDLYDSSNEMAINYRASLRGLTDCIIQNISQDVGIYEEDGVKLIKPAPEGVLAPQLQLSDPYFAGHTEIFFKYLFNGKPGHEKLEAMKLSNLSTVTSMAGAMVWAMNSGADIGGFSGTLQFVQTFGPTHFGINIDTDTFKKSFKYSERVTSVNKISEYERAQESILSRIIYKDLKAALYLDGRNSEDVISEEIAKQLCDKANEKNPDQKTVVLAKNLGQGWTKYTYGAEPKPIELKSDDDSGVELYMKANPDERVIFYLNRAATRATDICLVGERFTIESFGIVDRTTNSWVFEQLAGRDRGEHEIEADDTVVPVYKNVSTGERKYHDLHVLIIDPNVDSLTPIDKDQFASSFEEIDRDTERRARYTILADLIDIKGAEFLAHLSLNENATGQKILKELVTMYQSSLGLNSELRPGDTARSSEYALQQRINGFMKFLERFTNNRSSGFTLLSNVTQSIINEELEKYAKGDMKLKLKKDSNELETQEGAIALNTKMSRLVDSIRKNIAEEELPEVAPMPDRTRAKSAKASEEETGGNLDFLGMTREEVGAALEGHDDVPADDVINYAAKSKKHASSIAAILSVLFAGMRGGLGDKEELIGNILKLIDAGYLSLEEDNFDEFMNRVNMVEELTSANTKLNEDVVKSMRFRISDLGFWNILANNTAVKTSSYRVLASLIAAEDASYRKELAHFRKNYNLEPSWGLPGSVRFLGLRLPAPLVLSSVLKPFLNRVAQLLFYQGYYMIGGGLLPQLSVAWGEFKNKYAIYKAAVSEQKFKSQALRYLKKSDIESTPSLAKATVAYIAPKKSKESLDEISKENLDIIKQAISNETLFGKVSTEDLLSVMTGEKTVMEFVLKLSGRKYGLYGNKTLFNVVSEMKAMIVNNGGELKESEVNDFINESNMSIDQFLALLHISEADEKMICQGLAVRDGNLKVDDIATVAEKTGKTIKEVIDVANKVYFSVSEEKSLHGLTGIMAEAAEILIESGEKYKETDVEELRVVTMKTPHALYAAYEIIMQRKSEDEFTPSKIEPAVEDEIESLIEPEKAQFTEAEASIVEEAEEPAAGIEPQAVEKTEEGLWIPEGKYISDKEKKPSEDKKLPPMADETGAMPAERVLVASAIGAGALGSFIFAGPIGLAAFAGIAGIIGLIRHFTVGRSKESAEAEEAAKGASSPLLGLTKSALKSTLKAQDVEDDVIEQVIAQTAGRIARRAHESYNGILRIGQTITLKVGDRITVLEIKKDGLYVDNVNRGAFEEGMTLMGAVKRLSLLPKGAIRSIANEFEDGSLPYEVAWEAVKIGDEFEVTFSDKSGIVFDEEGNFVNMTSTEVFSRRAFADYRSREVEVIAHGHTEPIASPANGRDILAMKLREIIYGKLLPEIILEKGGLKAKVLEGNEIAIPQFAEEIEKVTGLVSGMDIGAMPAGNVEKITLPARGLAIEIKFSESGIELTVERMMMAEKTLPEVKRIMITPGMPAAGDLVPTVTPVISAAARPFTGAVGPPVKAPVSDEGTVSARSINESIVDRLKEAKKLSADQLLITHAEFLSGDGIDNTDFNRNLELDSLIKHVIAIDAPEIREEEVKKDIKEKLTSQGVSPEKIKRLIFVNLARGKGGLTLTDIITEQISELPEENRPEIKDARSIAIALPEGYEERMTDDLRAKGKEAASYLIVSDNVKNQPNHATTYNILNLLSRLTGRFEVVALGYTEAGASALNKLLQGILNVRWITDVATELKTYFNSVNETSKSL